MRTQSMLKIQKDDKCKMQKMLEIQADSHNGTTWHDDVRGWRSLDRHMWWMNFTFLHPKKEHQGGKIKILQFENVFSLLSLAVQYKWVLF